MIYLLVEGHGEIESTSKLAYKICHNLNYDGVHFASAIRTTNIHKPEKLVRAIASIQYKPKVDGLLIIKDEEDQCPKQVAPKIADYIRNHPVPFPVAFHLMYREFETLFVAYLSEFSGREIPHLISGTLKFKEGISAPTDPESKRDAKGIISSVLLGGKIYKPTVDQLTLTQNLDIDKMRALNLPCFGTLERCITHLVENKGTFSVYPPSSQTV